MIKLLLRESEAFLISEKIAVINMLSFLSVELVKLSVALGALSVALAAPMEYPILPPNSPNPSLEAVEANLRASAPVIENNSQQSHVRGLISHYARGFGVNEYLALELADIESDFKPGACNPQSTACGVYQWLKDSYWCEGNRREPNNNVICTMKTLLDPKGIRHWSIVTSTREKFIKMDLITCKDFKNNICRLK